MGKIKSVCFYYGYLDLIVGTKLPKYNLCYNTRDLIKSLAENANDRNELRVICCNWFLYILIIFKMVNFHVV